MTITYVYYFAMFCLPVLAHFLFLYRESLLQYFEQQGFIPSLSDTFLKVTLLRKVQNITTLQQVNKQSNFP